MKQSVLVCRHGFELWKESMTETNQTEDVYLLSGRSSADGTV